VTQDYGTQDYGRYSSARTDTGWAETPTATDVPTHDVPTTDVSATTAFTPGTSSGATSAETPTTQVAKDEARGVADTATQAGGQVAQTAKEQAREVTQEARQQARDLLGEGRTQVREQARAGQQRAASGLTSIADELREMVDKGGQSGVASELARQASERVQTFASWLERREPGELLDEARRWARQRPGAFLLGAAVAGVVAGRLTSGVVAAQRDSAGGDVSQRFTSEPGYGTGYSSTGYGSGAAYGACGS